MRASHGWFRGEVLSNFIAFGQSVDLWIRPIEFEVERRRRAQLGAITRPDAIRSLMGLPAGIPIAMAAIAPLDRLVLEALSPAIIRTHRTEVERLAVPPVQLVGIVKRAHSWDDVQAVSLLRTHAPRVVIASAALARRIIREADPEIGVADVDDVQTTLRPPGRRWIKPSWQRWLIAELAYDAWRAA
jgi:hypothetical protein